MSEISFLRSNQSLGYDDAVIPTTPGANEARNEACGGGGRIRRRCSLGEGVEHCVLCVMQRRATQSGACGAAADRGTALCRCVSLGDFMSQRATHERLGALRSGGGGTRD